MKKSLLTIGLLALLAVLPVHAGTTIAPGQLPPPNGVPQPPGAPIRCDYWSCDHYQIGYEINVVTVGCGYWTVWPDRHAVLIRFIRRVVTTTQSLLSVGKKG